MSVTMRPYDPQKPIIYTHIPKCAGTSFVHLLRRWFQHDYHKLNQDETKDILLPKVETRAADGRWLPNVKCIHGHFNHGRGYGLPYYYPEVEQYFTVLRDPFDIVVSMYFFVKARSAEGKFWSRGRQVDIRVSFPDVESYVSDYPGFLFHHFPQDITLDNYREKLSQRFVHIGIQEDLQTSVDALARVLGKPPFPVPRANVSVYDEPVPEYLRHRFHQDYPLLKCIYDFARETYRQPLQGANALPAKLAS